MSVAFEMKNIEKVYDNSVRALDKVSLKVEQGQIHGLLGENGAGKSTLMKILYGIEKPTNEGEIYIEGQRVFLDSANAALKCKIGMVHQHFMLIPSLSVVENVVLGNIPKKAGFLTDMKTAREKVSNLCREYGFIIDVNEKVKNLSVGTKQKVEILKVLYLGAKILILDEPTAVLNQVETAELFDSLKKLASKKIAIVFISHKLEEIRKLCQKVTILKTGEVKGTFDIDKISKNEILQLMVGDYDEINKKNDGSKDREVAVEVKTLSVVKEKDKSVSVENLDFSANAGEIFGIAGVAGNGQTEVFKVLTGLNKNYSGKVCLLGEDIGKLSIKTMKSMGIGCIVEDRMLEGLSINNSILENLFACSYGEFTKAKGRLLDYKKMQESACEVVKKFSIECKDIHEKVSTLSGGNMQKILIAREILSNPKILIANQPTRGVDIKVANFIRNQLLELKNKGCCVIIISSDLEEIIEICDRVAVMYNGGFNFIGENNGLRVEDITKFMIG